MPSATAPLARRQILRAAALFSALAISTVAVAADRIKIGLNPGPTVDVVRVVQKVAAARGLEVEIVEISDWIRPNLALDDGAIDVNFYQNTAYLNTQLKKQNLNIVPVAAVWSIQSGLFSKKIKSLNELPERASVSVASDPLNGARGLLLLEKAGLIKLKPGVGIDATTFDVVSNPKNLKIVQVEGPQLARSLDDVYLSAISPYIYIPAGIDRKTALVEEDWKDPLFHQVIVARKDRVNDPKIQKFIASFQSPEVKQYIQEKYPAFKVLW
ncbi:MetQ/NlpA family ABC transporter substrate-binding protein [Variovorax sp. J2P1-59]|uniref:MetQ/NlpA family ABC transporter substrate-binding protein n=1 Tax=Variovorax flavidus TaxID=3053501 RepID=UPI002574F3C0|nr:MetQ/NlpA family ABC transporter substrate-binding protein [Variovorax sp. J2P1-59]MDM0078603.1 MetQ/NlpA family ABC transporter substrate-binding protein [Variovorax sp. J2P1-59]